MLLALFGAVMVLAALGGALYLSRSFRPRQRVVFWVVVVLGALYVVPRLYQGMQAGYRVGAGLREQDNH